MDRIMRIHALQDKMIAEGLSGALLFYSRDIFYYTGTAQPSYLAVLPDDYILFVRSGFDVALQDVFIDKKNIREERRLSNISKEILSGMKGSAKKIATELDLLTVEQFRGFREIFADSEFVNASLFILEQRKNKDLSEITEIKAACEAIHKGHVAAVSTLREGVTELELAAAVENAHRLSGHEGIFFIRQPDFFMSRGPVASGPNLFNNSGVVYTITGTGLSPAVPAGPSQRRITRGDIVVVDIPTLVRGYHADQTRTYCLGKAGTKIRSMYDDLKTIADHLIDRIKPGMPCRDIYGMALNEAGKLRREHHFLNFGKGKRSRMIGHGIGLELNEPPILSEYDRSEIGEHCVIALDMHMMDEGQGVVKIEDMILIKEGGNEILTKSPRDLCEIE
ncbi:MAG: Xaa-Pro peptidase family protein [Deltaproteobacteria bacterium]|nr:Xaa-Pro peptidase family protein [Deltaproteobacteria bacterium]